MMARGSIGRTIWPSSLGTGKLVAKAITDPAKFKETDFQGNPQKFVLLPTNFDISAVDQWAAQTHFNVDKGFTLKGLKEILSRAGH